MSLKILHPWKLSAYLSLSVADFFLTYRLVQESGGRVYESNPIAHAWLSGYGWSGLLFFKLVAVLLVGVVCIYISCHRPRLGGNILLFACASVAAVVMYSCSIAGFFGERALPPGTVARGSERHHRPTTPEQELWRQLVGEALAEKIGLSEAVDKLAITDQWKTSRWFEGLRQANDDSFSDEACLAAHFIFRVRWWSQRRDLPEADRICSQLQAEFVQRYGQPCPEPLDGGYWQHKSERPPIEHSR